MSVVYIYGLIDPRNNQIFYVGFTQNIKKRFDIHLNIDGNRREKNLYKDNVIRKILNSGLKPKIIILDSCEKNFNIDYNKYEHEILEIYYIKKYNDSGIKLTNLTTGGDGGCTYQQKVFQYSEDGIFLNEYESVNECADIYNVNPDIISKVIDQRGKKSYRATYLFSSKEKANSFEFKKTIKIIPISQYTLNGEFVAEYKNQAEAFNMTQISQSSISNCVNDKSRQAGGYMWYNSNSIPMNIQKTSKYFNTKKPIIQYNLNGNIISEFKSISEASKILNIKTNLIVTNLKKITKTCKGFIFTYKN